MIGASIFLLERLPVKRLSMNWLLHSSVFRKMSLLLLPPALRVPRVHRVTTPYCGGGTVALDSWY